MRRLLRSSLLAFLIGFVAIIPARSDAQSPWILELGGGATTPYAYHTYPFSFGTFHDKFDASWNAFFSAGRRVGRNFVIQSQVGYSQFQEPVALGFSGDGYGGGVDSRLQARFVSVGIGLRASRETAQVTRPRPYAQILPTVYVARWSERTEYEQGYQQVAHTEEYSSTWVSPGIEAGIGLVGPLHGPLKLDVGFRYKYSADPGRKMLGQYSSGDFDGFRQFDLVAAVLLSK